MSDIQISIEMIGDDRNAQGGLMQRIRETIQAFGRVDTESYQSVDVVQKLVVSLTVSTTTVANISISGGRDIEATVAAIEASFAQGARPRVRRFEL